MVPIKSIYPKVTGCRKQINVSMYETEPRYFKFKLETFLNTYLCDFWNVLKQNSVIISQNRFFYAGSPRLEHLQKVGYIPLLIDRLIVFTLAL